MNKIIFLATACLALVGGHASGEEAPKDWRQTLVVPHQTPSPELTSAQENLANSLAEIRPQAKAKPKSIITKDKYFILYGNLFKTGTCFALCEMVLQAENDEPRMGYLVALAEWTKSKWQIRGLWNIPVVWRPKGWKQNERIHDDYLPVTPATEPFELKDLNGDGVPEVIVAGEVNKYFQEFYLLRFVPETHGLALLESSMGRPEHVGKYVRLYSNSGRRAIFEEYAFMRWSGDKLILKASWHDETPYNGIAPSFEEAEVADNDGTVKKYRITDAEDGTYSVTKNEKPYASLSIAWNKPPNEQMGENTDEIEKAWLFEKITGLPRNLYPWNERNKKHLCLEDLATVRVTGNEEAARMFSSPHSHRQ
jgi:hypothetical protein